MGRFEDQKREIASQKNKTKYFRQYSFSFKSRANILWAGLFFEVAAVTSSDICSWQYLRKNSKKDLHFLILKDGAFSVADWVRQTKYKVIQLKLELIYNDSSIYMSLKTLSPIVWVLSLLVKSFIGVYGRELGEERKFANRHKSRQTVARLDYCAQPGSLCLL